MVLKARLASGRAVLWLALLMVLAVSVTSCGRAATPDVSGFAPVDGANSASTAPAPSNPQAASPAESDSSNPSSNAANPGEPVALVDGQPIYQAEFEKRVQQFLEADTARGVQLSGEQAELRLNEIRNQVLEGLIDQIVIEQAAARMNIQVDEATLQANIAEMQAGQSDEQFAQWLSMNDFTYDDFRQTLASQLIASQLFEQIAAQAPQSAEQVNVRHILFTDLAMAQESLQRLQNGEDFATLAQQLSMDTQTGPLGGSLGWLPRGVNQVPPQVENAAFSLEVGQLSPVIESVLGYHLIKVDDKQADRPLSPEHLQALQGQLFNNWLMQQRASANVEKLVTW